MSSFTVYEYIGKLVRKVVKLPRFSVVYEEEHFVVINVYFCFVGSKRRRSSIHKGGGGGGGWEVKILH